MHGNGADAYAQLAARVAELETAVGLIARKWEAELIPRLLELDRDLDNLQRVVVRYIETSPERR